MEIHNLDARKMLQKFGILASPDERRTEAEILQDLINSGRIALNGMEVNPPNQPQLPSVDSEVI